MFLEEDVHREKPGDETKAETGCVQPRAKDCRKAPEARKSEEGVLCSFQREHGSADTLFGDFWAPELRGVTFPSF